MESMLMMYILLSYFNSFEFKSLRNLLLEISGKQY